MVRKLVKVLLSLILVAPAAALALGVGDVQLHSALNQRLDAKINLLSVDPAEADTIEVSLASYEDFARVGLERPSSLMFLNFDVEQSPSGNYYIKLSSREAIREPFLDFLVEVKWRSGRVLREYTLLLDPPTSHQEAAPIVAAPVTAPSVETAPAVETAQAEAEEDEFVPPPSSIPVAPGYEDSEVETRTTPAPSVATAEKAPVPTAPALRSIVYGPVKANETLWSIARKLRPNKDISDQQMMMALLIANPYAFIDNNINRLKKGYVLRIDDLSVLTAMNKAEAAREVSRQTRAWQDYRAAVAAKAAKKASVSAAAKETPSTKAVGSSSKEPKLELVSPEGKGDQAGKATEGGDKLQQELMLALESSAAQRKENEELEKRLQLLEEELQETKRMLTLKSDDLATLQEQLRKQGQALTLPSSQSKTESTEAESKPADATTPEQVNVEGAASESKAPEGEGAAEQGASAPGSAPEKAGKTAAEAASAQQSTAKPAEKPAEPKKPAEAKKPTTEKTPASEKKIVKKPPVVVPPAEDPSIVDTIFGTLESFQFDDPMMLAAGGGAALLVLLLLLIVIRRRRGGGGFQESILTAGSSSMMGSEGEGENSETSFLSDLAISGMGKSTIHTDEGEVDPLTEADVFMAYGRHQQAEEVLSKAHEKHPDRIDITTKLLEVYYNLEDSDKFVALAGKSADGLKKQGEWPKIEKMGHELSPQSALFAAGAAVAATAAVASPESPAGDVLDIGLDLDDLSPDMGAGDSGGEDLGFDLGFDLDDMSEGENTSGGSETIPAVESAPVGSESEFEFDLDLGAEAADDSAPAEESTGLDFDLGDLVEEEAPAADTSDEFELNFGAEEESGVEVDDMSLDFGLDSSAEAEPAEEEAGAGLDLGELGDLDFGDFGLEESELQAENAAEETFDLDMSDDMDMGSDLDMSGLESAGDDLGDLSELGGLGDLDDEGMFGDSDEITTKLDLAQAYIEMGDNDGARSMLEEVADAGNDEQKLQAQELLAKI